MGLTNHLISSCHNVILLTSCRLMMICVWFWVVINAFYVPRVSAVITVEQNPPLSPAACCSVSTPQSASPLYSQCGPRVQLLKSDALKNIFKKMFVTVFLPHYSLANKWKTSTRTQNKWQKSSSQQKQASYCGNQVINLFALDTGIGINE